MSRLSHRETNADNWDIGLARNWHGTTEMGAQTLRIVRTLRANPESL